MGPKAAIAIFDRNADIRTTLRGQQKSLVELPPVMDLKTTAVVFGSVFLAELGDKTQLATMLFATRDSVSLASVFAGASLALILSTAIAVSAGAALSNLVDPRFLSYAAGVGFVVIGAWILWRT